MSVATDTQKPSASEKTKRGHIPFIAPGLIFPEARHRSRASKNQVASTPSAGLSNAGERKQCLSQRHRQDQETFDRMNKINRMTKALSFYVWVGLRQSAGGKDFIMSIR